MPVIEDLKKTVDPTPFFAAVGATDLAVEKVREARCAPTRPAPSSAPTSPRRRSRPRDQIADQVKEIPAVVLNETLVIGGKVAEGYGSPPATSSRPASATRRPPRTSSPRPRPRSPRPRVVTTARKAASDVERSAKATLTTGRKEAAKVAAVVTGSVVEETKVAKSEVKKSAKATHHGQAHLDHDQERREEDHLLGQGRDDERRQDRRRCGEGDRAGRREGRRLTSRRGRRTADDPVTGPLSGDTPDDRAGSPARSFGVRAPCRATTGPDAAPLPGRMLRHPRAGCRAIPGGMPVDGARG